MSIQPLRTVSAEALEQLLDAAFGTDRHGRTAYALREGIAQIEPLSFAWVEQRELLGSVQCWPVELDGPDGACPMIMVGPVAVRPDRQKQGIGIALMDHMIAAHDARSEAERYPMMMIGDQPYYGRWNFSAEATGGWKVPGPVARHRLLARSDDPAALPATGMLGPRR